MRENTCTPMFFFVFNRLVPGSHRTTGQTPAPAETIQPAHPRRLIENERYQRSDGYIFKPAGC